MTKYNFTLEDLRREVLSLADERPDFVYTSQPGCTMSNCGYTGIKPGTTEGEGCIYGQALMRLGVEEKDLTHQEGNIYGVLYGISGIELEDYGPEVNLFEAFGDVQKRQDRGIPWGNAVESLRHRTIPSA